MNVPNVSAGPLNPFPFGENTNLNIYTSTGIKLLSKQIQSEKGANTLILKLDLKINKRFYLLEVTNGNERNTSRFI